MSEVDSTGVHRLQELWTGREQNPADLDSSCSELAVERVARFYDIEAAVFLITDPDDLQHCFVA